MNISGDLDTAGVYGIDDEQQIGICPGCNGTGEAHMGRFSPRPSTCRECGGSGEIEVDG